MVDINEEWKDVPGYDGLYKVSNLGRVKSLKWDREKILKACNYGGYYGVNLCKESKCKYHKIHQLVALCFLNHKPNGINLVVDHIDNNSLNNRLDNLQVITQNDNASKDKKSKSGLKGVRYCPTTTKWQVSVTWKRKTYWVGRFDCKYKASEEREKKLKELMNG